ncbi:MAG TPA: hypothetical protein PKE31_12300 [Pseudomonadota bacterium]|nr:hypothetical protein [Pseudomonadota bacterium]
MTQALLGSLFVFFLCGVDVGRAFAQSSQPSASPQTGGAYQPLDGNYAQPPPPPPPPPPAPERPNIARSYFQLTMGFMAGGRSYSDSSFESQNGVAANLTEPFVHAPFVSETVMGLRYDLRVVYSYIRGTIGVDFPFSTFRGRDATGTYSLNGQTVNVAVQSLRPYELRFGIGGEYPVWAFAPFVDIIGYAYWANVGAAVNDEKADFQARGFGFSARGGLRAHVKPWFFVQAAGEAGLYGPVRWNAELSIGFSAHAKRY